MEHQSVEARSADVRLLAGYELLQGTASELTTAGDLAAIMTLACAAARALVQADGASFVLPEGSTCLYAHEDAIAPLWPGRRFELDDSIDGLALRQRQPIVVDDTGTDPRVNGPAVSATFVRSIVSVPVRAAAPVAAIGAYWAVPRPVEEAEVRLLQALADAVATAMANLERFQRLEDAAAQRAQDLESLSYAISHDLRAPIRHLEGFTRILLDDLQENAELSDRTQHNVQRIQDAGENLRNMVDALLALSRASRAEVRLQPLDLAELGRQIAAVLAAGSGPRASVVEFAAPPNLPVTADPRLIQTALQHLLENAWKFTAGTPQARVELGIQPDDATGTGVYFVRDNGVGFETSSTERLFGVFQRLHRPGDFAGVGIGLAMTKRIIAKHNGRIWATSTPPAGATFYFTLPAQVS